MVREEFNTIFRRDVLTIGAVGMATGLAGCSTGSETEGDSSETEDPDPEYEEISDYESSVDAQETDTYSFTAGVERDLDGETTLLNAEITDAYVIRDNEDYDDDILEDVGAYNER